MSLTEGLDTEEGDTACVRSQAGGSRCSLNFHSNLSLVAVTNVTNLKSWIPTSELPGKGLTPQGPCHPG